MRTDLMVEHLILRKLALCDWYLTWYSVLGTKRECFSGESISWGLPISWIACKSLHQHCRFPPKQCMDVKASNIGKKLQNLANTKHRAIHFLNKFYLSGNVLFCKFCQNNVDFKHVCMCKHHLWCKAWVKKGKSLCCTVSDGIKYIKG